ncbi:MAG TPA: TRAP transporter substrate-binding protein [Syntrophorhabdales bacterium]|nr:TRAP transporter substrate-binding protein [Syntrophorhabdales bacterium]
MGRQVHGFIAIAVFVLAVFCSVSHLPAAGAESGPAVLRFAGWHPIEHHCTRGQELYAKLVMEKTKKVTIEVYPSSQLFSDKDMVRAVQTGAVEIGVIPTGLVTGQIPLLLVFDIPFLFRGREHYHRWLDDPEVSQAINVEFEKRGYHILYWMDFGSFGIASTKPLKTIEDFKGKRIRAPGEMMVEGVRALGAAPTMIGSGEVYMALQRNTIDAAISGWTSLLERKYYEVSKHLIDANYGMGFFPITINKKTWESLPKDVQSIMTQAAVEAQSWGRKECQKSDLQDLEQLKKKGMQYYLVPEKERERWVAATKPCVELFLKRVGDQDKGKKLLEKAQQMK